MIPRRILVPLMATLQLALVAGSALAAGSAKCASLERKTHSRLDRGITACGRLPSLQTAACEKSKWSKYDVRLTKVGCPIPPRGGAGDEGGLVLDSRIKRPLVIAIRARDGRPDDLASADRAVLAAFDGYVSVLRRLDKSRRVARASRRPGAFSALTKEFVPLVQRALEQLRAAEKHLADVERSVWGSFPTRWSLNAVVDQPLAAAMEELQIELRRLLYPVFQSEVTGVRSMAGCQGDLIHDRLIAAFGEAMIAAGNDRSAETAALGRITAQLACLSAEQTSLLDAALAEASTRVAAWITAAGLVGVDESVARLTAPLELLLFDAVKHEGEHSASWRWFVQLSDVLRDQISRLGWPTGDVVWLYDRIDGRMIGFPPCGDDINGRCVDLDTLLQSITDPRAIGRGDCALAGMVAAGPKSLGADSRYACPSLDCTAASSGATTGGRIGGIGSIGGILDRFRTSPDVAALPWSGLGAVDISSMRALSCGSGGGTSGGGGGTGGGRTAQGPGGSLGDWGGPQECTGQAIVAASDPFDSYTHCLIDGTGSSPGLGGAASDPGELRGVPNGGGCSPVADGEPGGSGTSNPSPPSSTATTTPPTTTPPTTIPPDPVVEQEEDDLVDTVINLITTFFGKGPTTLGPVVGAEKTLLDPDNAKEIYDAVGAAWTHEIAAECASAGDGGMFSASECKVLGGLPAGDQKEYYNWKKGNVPYDCAGPEDCDSSCTSLNQQVMERLQDCTQQQIQSLQPDVDPLDPVINPSPEDPGSGGLPDDPLMSCMLATADGGRDVNLACGFVTCTDQASTAMSASSCCGRAAGSAIGVAAGRLLGAHVCEAVLCADDAATVLDGVGVCGCGSAVSDAGGGEPSAPTPSPAGPRGGGFGG